MFLKLDSYCKNLIKDFDLISDERKEILTKISNYIQKRKDKKLDINLIYICTHNSRRSHFGQVWSAVASEYYRIKNVFTFSGGTEATSFNKNAIQALKSTGFDIIKNDETSNPKYSVFFDETKFINCFSKVYDDESNPKNNFVAIMTCSDAEVNCPFISGAELRIGTTYNDPKEYDETEFEAEKYLERSKQIALETFFLFSLVK